MLAEIEIVRRFKRWRGGRESEPTLPWETIGYAPDWWEAETERLFAGLRELQDEALRLICPSGGGNADLLRPGEVRGVLEGIATWDITEDDRVTLEVPTGFYLDSPLLDYRTVSFYGAAESRPGGSRLRRLQDLAAQVQYLSGCRPWEAIGYLLCGEIPWVPAIEVKVGDPPACIQIVSRHPEVPVEVFAAAYKQARQSLGVTRGRSRDRRSGWPAVVYEFVEKWRKANGRLRWKEIWEQFAVSHPDAPYVRSGSLDSLRVTYYQKRTQHEERSRAPQGSSQVGRSPT